MGFVVGSIACMVLVSLIEGALGYYPSNSVSKLLLLLCLTVGGSGGAIVGVVLGIKRFRGKKDEITVYIIVGCLIGLLGSTAYAVIVNSINPDRLSELLATPNIGFCVVIGVATGSIMGCIVGVIVTFLR